jgi:hypothetical protein
VGRLALGLATLLAAAFLGAPAQGATITYWTGAAGTDFATAGNWTNGVPASNDYQYAATLADTYPPSATAPANKTPALASGRSLGMLNFSNSIGWSLSGAQLVLSTLQSSGNGTNSIANTIKTANKSVNWSIGAGNEVDLNGGLIQDGSGYKVTFTGGGTLKITGGIRSAYSSSHAFYLNEGSLIIDSATPYQADASPTDDILHFNGADSILQLKTTVANAQSQIGTKIVDDLGQGLSVTDIGGGFVQITSVPEPASIGLLVMGASMLLTRRRRP